MSLMTRLRLSGESSLEEGTPDEVLAKKRRVLAEKLRPARMEAARHNPKWTEIENDLVIRNDTVGYKHGPGYKPVPNQKWFGPEFDLMVTPVAPGGQGPRIVVRARLVEQSPPAPKKVLRLPSSE